MYCFCVDAQMYGRFRKAMAKNELTRRTLALTRYIIEECPAHYTVWYYRQCIVRHLLASDPDIIEHELTEFLDDFTRDNKKNYQIWYLYFLTLNV